jgi:hypothetical protein
MTTLWDRVLDALGAADVDWCLLRGGPDGAISACGGDVDLLVAPRDLQSVEQLLDGLGFVRLRSWGYAPHRFFIGYDELSDRWLKLDIVDRITFGSPVHTLDTDLGPLVLARRRLIAGVFIPAPEHELLALLLHGILDKRHFPADRRSRLQELCHDVDRAQMSGLLTAYWPSGPSWPELRTCILEDRCQELLEQRPLLWRHLTRGGALCHGWRQVRDRVLRKLDRGVRLLQPSLPTVALLAPDGAGKSTLAAELCRSFVFPVRQVYMGLPHGPRAARRRVPGAGLARLMLRQWSRYLQGRFHRGRGRLVVFDRYTYDALMPATRPLNRLRRMRRWLLAHACPAPDLIVVLDAPGEILHERKGEHTVAHLEAQRQAYRRLHQHLPQTVVIDASRTAGEVRSDVTAAIWRRYRERELPRGGRP